NLKIAQTGTTNYLIDANLTFKAGIYYSVFAIDSVSKIKAAVAEDVLFVPAADSARVRFFQFSPNTPYLSAKFKNTVTGDSLFYSGRTFNDQSNNSTLAGFKQIKSGTYNLSITLLPDTIVYKTFTGIQFLSGKNYTVYLKGFNGATSIQQLSLGVVEHNK
ncbi:MAG TPA: DUF4397 domain-containing protein, partial [Panacibacter sp.]|nr:DUF4397 domain-containing protein [Panacibacter sp.]